MLHAPLCGIVCPNLVAVARYDALIRTKSSTNCDAHLAESFFQTRSSTVRINKIPKTFLVKSKDRISLTESYAKRIIRTTKYTCTQLKIPNPRADCIDKNTKSETMVRSIFKGKMYTCTQPLMSILFALAQQEKGGNSK